MSPLDTGSVAHILRLVDPLERAGPDENDYPTLGEYLRAMREHKGLTLAELSHTTRVSKTYLKALEEGDGSALPARPFTIGYVRAYAKALDLDDEAAAARYKRETPSESEALRNPIGVKHEGSPKSPWVIGGVLLVVAAVIGWNVVQRATAPKEPALPAAAALDAPAPAPAQPGTIALGAATPPPAEQTTPIPYVTPGLMPVDPTLSTTPGAVTVPGSAPSAPPAKFPSAFATKSPIYGAPAGPASALLQAGRPASLIVRGPSGAVHFARQLAAGEAYRAPLGQRLTAEVTDPSAFGFYVDGALRGSLVSPTTPIDQAAAESAPRPAAPPAAAPAATAAAPAPVPPPAR